MIKYYVMYLTSMQVCLRRPAPEPIWQAGCNATSALVLNLIQESAPATWQVSPVDPDAGRLRQNDFREASRKQAQASRLRKSSCEAQILTPASISAGGSGRLNA